MDPRSTGSARLLAVAVAQADKERLWPMLWGVQQTEVADVQYEVLAGLDGTRWRWGVDIEAETAWLGPAADVAPRLALPSGRTVAAAAALRPHPGARPWTDAPSGSTSGRWLATALDNPPPWPTVSLDTWWPAQGGDLPGPFAMAGPGTCLVAPTEGSGQASVMGIWPAPAGRVFLPTHVAAAWPRPQASPSQ